MKVFLRLSIALSLVLLMVSCGNSVKVVNFSPEGECNNLTTFTVEFSKDLAPADMQDKWLTDEFISFEPKIQGKFKWLSASRLIFSPDVMLEPMQDYRAEITKKVLFNTVYTLDTKTYKFHTPDFNVSKIDLFWTQIPNQYYRMSVQANIQFNYPVIPDQLRQYLEVKRDGNIVNDFQVITTTKSDMISISLGEIQQTDKEQDFTILIKKGLLSTVGKKPLQDDKKFDRKVPPITQLTITGVASGFDGSTGWIEVGTTQMVDEKKIKDYVTTDPAKKLNFFISDNLFRIETDFENMQTVALKIKKGLQGLYGGVLQDDFDQEVTFANLNPSINFVDKKGKYLMLGGQKNLQVNSVNIDEAEIEVSKVYKNNILFFLNQYSYDYGYEGDYGWNPDYYVGDYGKSLYTEKVNLKNAQNWLEKFTVNLDKIINSPQNLTTSLSKGEGDKSGKWDNAKGIYIVNVHSAQDRWISDSKIIAMSDLAIIAKKSGNQLLVFVNSIASAEPVYDVDINIISTNNQTILTGKTDAKGVARFDDLEKNIEGFTPRLIIAEKDKDFNYLDFKETFIETSRFDVGGMYEISDNYMVFLYGDRNIYRPGETVYLSGIVRDENIKNVNSMPVIIKIITPTGKVLDEYKKNLNGESSFELSFKVPEYVQTGDYVAEVQTGSNVLIGSYKFSVEDFVPDKIRLTLKNDKNSVKPGENVKVKIDAEFLFGAKASDLKYEAHINLKHKQFSSKNYSDFEFNNSSVTNGNLPEFNTDGFLDKEGRAEINYVVPDGLKSSGIIAGFAYVNVFDLTGRTVNRISSFDVYPKSYFIGIKSPGYYFGTNDRINFKVVAVNPDDKAIGDFTGTAKLIRYEWQTVIKKDNSNRYYWASEEKEIQEWEKNLDISGGAKNISFNVSKSGKYALRISKKGEDDYQSKTFYAYGWASSTASSFQVDREGRIDIVLDKKVYQPGEKAKVLFTCPFSGKMLVTIERNGVYDYQYVNVENKSAQLNLPVYDSYMPNVYISATLFKKHTIDNSTPFLVGHGFVPIKVEKKQNKIPVSISVPKKIKPNTTQYVNVKTGGGRDVYVTLAAVDEGILQVKNFETPDPYSYMYAKRALNVESYDLYKLLLPEIVKGNSLTGGGDDKRFLAQLQKRTNPIPSKRYTLFAFWSGIVKTNSSGQVTIPVKVPQFNGEIRLMAVAYTGSKFGSVEEHIKCADDLIIEPEVPRFLSINDSLIMPVTVINTTSKKGNVKLNVNVEGVIRLVSGNTENGSIEPNSTKQFVFAIKSDNNIGQGKITFEASGIAKVKEEINIGVRPVSPLVTETGAGILRNGQNVKLNIPTNYLQGTQFTTVSISKFPAIRFARQLKYLIGYPYGCIEQTVSKCFPQIYFVDLGPLIAPDIFKNTNSVYYVKEGIRKVESMQLYDGSMAYWPGWFQTSWWGSVYAGHFLIEARKAGFEVRENVLNKLLSYISKKSKEHSTYDYPFYTSNKRYIRKIANKEILYSLYVLALANRGDISTMNYYKARLFLLSNDSRYLLAGAYALMGKWGSYYELIPKSYSPEITDRLSGGCFDSEIRANAIMLNVLLEVDPNNTQIPYIVKYLSDNVSEMLNTQEQAFAFLALGKAAAKNAKSDMKVAINVNNKTINTYSGKDLSESSTEFNYGNVSLKAWGSGEVYYFWSTEGIKAYGKVREEDNFMRVRKTFYDYKTKKEIRDNVFTQGELVVCKITLTGFERSADNIVITDMIPSGFEIENPRLSTSAGINWQTKFPLKYQYLDVRDDRLLLFTQLESKTTQEYYYLARVVNQGVFQKPVIGAEGMYAPEFHSYNGAGWVKVISSRGFLSMR